MLLWRHRFGLQEFRKLCSEPKMYPVWLTLQDDFIVQWRLGNRGAWGVWL